MEKFLRDMDVESKINLYFLNRYGFKLGIHYSFSSYIDVVFLYVEMDGDDKEGFFKLHKLVSSRFNYHAGLGLRGDLLHYYNRAIDYINFIVDSEVVTKGFWEGHLDHVVSVFTKFSNNELYGSNKGRIVCRDYGVIFNSNFFDYNFLFVQKGCYKFDLNGKPSCIFLKI